MTWEVLAPLSLNLTYKQQAQIRSFYELLVQENLKYNLTRITDWNELLAKHILDSLLFSQEINLANQHLVDIGSGAGFPGIVLKIVFPQLKITLLEANQKKAGFLNLVIKRLELQDIKVVAQRAEIYGATHRNHFDLVISRATAPLRILLELAAPLIKSQGWLVALKGPLVAEEKSLVGNLEQKLGLAYDREQVSKQSYGERINLFYQKVRATPSLYPRPYRIIKKEFNDLRKK